MTHFKIDDSIELPSDELQNRSTRGRHAVEGGPTASATEAFKQYADAYYKTYGVRLEMRFYDAADKVVRFGKVGWPFGQNETVQRLKELTKKLNLNLAWAAK